jgi:perosamine synthetase
VRFGYFYDFSPEGPMIEEYVKKAREIYGGGFIPLHRPVFEGNEKEYLLQCIDSNFVSSVGQRVVDFENMVASFVGSKFAVAVVNGTAGLEIAMRVAGVDRDTEVITQDLTFVATANSICHIGAHPIFLDVDDDSLSLSPEALSEFLLNNTIRDDGELLNKKTGRKIAGCVPMHTFGNPGRIEDIVETCFEWGIPVIEDAAEALGSYANGKHVGTFGTLGVVSFNGNKVITTGGGGMVITDNEEMAKRVKHLTTTAKVEHAYEFVHDEIAFNYRLPNLNAALGCAQMETLREQLRIKRDIADMWEKFFQSYDVRFVRPIIGSEANNWLNTIVLESKSARDEFLAETNRSGIMTRPAWELMSRLPIFSGRHKQNTPKSAILCDTLVNISSSVPVGRISI